MASIFIVTAVSEIATGGGKHLFSLAQGIHNRGRDICVVCLQPGTFHNALRSEGVPALLNPVHGKIDLRGFLSARNLFQENMPRIVHSHGERGMFIANWVSKSLSISSVITTIHRSITHTGWPWLKKLAFQVIEDFTLRYATTEIIAVSDSMKEELVQVRNHNPQKVKVIHNGIPIPTSKEIAKARQKASNLRQELGFDQSTYIVGSVGRLVREKGYPHLIEAISIISESNSNVGLILVGDGPEYDVLQKLSLSLGIADHVRAVGHHMNINEWLATFDLFVLPSIWESFGMAIAEAMTFAIPVISTEVAGPTELIHDHYSGILVPPSDPIALAQAIVYMQENPARAQQIGETGQAMVSQHFSVDTMVEKVLKVYDKAL